MSEDGGCSARTFLVPRWLWLAGLLAAILTAAQGMGVAYMGSGWAAPRGMIGIDPPARCDWSRFCVVTRVRPGSPADRAGIVPGDRVRPDRYWERHRTHAPGEILGMTLRHTGGERHIDLVAAPVIFYAPTFIVSGIANTIGCLIALLILARAGLRWPNYLLGCALISRNIPGGYPRFWQNAPSLYPWFFAGLSVAYMCGPILMLAALRAIRRELTGGAPRWLDRLLAVAAIGALSATMLGVLLTFTGLPLLGIDDDLLPTSLAWSLTSLLGPVALAAGWRNVPAAARTRYAFLWAAVAVVSIHPAVDPMIIAGGNNYVVGSWPVLIQLVSDVLGAMLFAYAILRHRVIDLGFAINRTLVYSTLSFLTLTIFGLVEWASEKLLPLESREANAVLDAGVALILFLTFHRIHAWIESWVERIFFHRWHSSEAALRRFLLQASYITDPATLIDRALAELGRFCGGADAALYRPGRHGYERVAGNATAPAFIDVDAPAPVEMRAERTIVRGIFAGGDLALPMIHRGELTGFFLLGHKPSGDPYRSDEEAALGEAAIRIGLDLYAARVEELLAANALLSSRLELLGVSSAQALDRGATGPAAHEAQP